MRIVCPICSAAYEVRDDLLVPGRAVRCARCGEEWVAVQTEPEPRPAAQQSEPEAQPVEPPPAAPDETAPRLTAMDRLARQPAPLPRAVTGLRAAWAASVLALMLFGWGLIAWRTDLMHAWPPSMRLYDAIGMSPAKPPLR